MENVQNKTAIVTGGGSGIGYCIIEELLRNGAKRVAVIDLPIPRTHEALNKLQAEFGKQRVILFECDITKPEYEETFKKAVNALGGLDILVNNAGIGDESKVERMFAVNSVALIRGSLYGLNYMSKHKGGKGGTIVNIASVAGLRQFSFIPVYAATKHAVVGFSQALKDYYDKTEVRVLTMCPDMTKTSIAETVTFLEFVDMGNMWQDAFMVGQSPTNVACAVVELIQKGKNGAIWSVKVGERPHAHEFQPVTSVPV